MKQFIMILATLLVSITAISQEPQETAEFLKAKKEYLQDILSKEKLREFKKLERKFFSAQESQAHLSDDKKKKRTVEKGQCGYYEGMGDCSWEETAKPRYEERKKKYFAFIKEHELDLTKIIGKDQIEEIPKESKEEQLAIVNEKN